MTEFGSDLILARLERLHPRKIDLSLERMWRLLSNLGHPERHLPPVIHIAGTNGKGSTLAFLDAMLRAQGCIVDRYVSPHLVHFNERILIDGEPIAETDLARALDSAECANDGAPITFFEITTAAAMLAFAEHSADYLLLETGLGGRFDATNVVERPLLTLLSPISMDHQAFLGDTIDRIAFEKAGILKHGVVAMSGPQTEAGMAVLAQRASAIRAPLLTQGRDWKTEQIGQELRFTDSVETLHLPRPMLEGVHQIENAGLAIAAARSLGVGPTAIAAGLANAEWPGRMQRIRSGPFINKLGRQHQLWIDGGHNPSAGIAIGRSLETMAALMPVHLVVGMPETKDLLGFIKPLARCAQSMIFVPMPGGHVGHEPDDMRRVATSVGIVATVQQSLETAIAAIAMRNHEPSLVLVCGSLYLAGGRDLRDLT
ncbi:MAG: folylpolyglutamate synthase/dihydrofolate synthase family protein [Pseudomonadota bacterium]